VGNFTTTLQDGH
jgi:hypothetical protein